MIDIPFSEACERNKNVILDVLSPYLSKVDTVLEVGTGTAQHAVYFAPKHPQLTWQTSDQDHYLEGINAQLAHAKVVNVLTPFELNVNQSPWVPDHARYDAVYTANTFHIMTWLDVQAFFAGLSKVTKEGSYLFVYGPFKYKECFTSESNQVFDNTLRSRGCGSAIRDFEKVNELAQQSGFQLLEDHAMPANNQCLIWQSIAT